MWGSHPHLKCPCRIADLQPHDVPNLVTYLQGSSAHLLCSVYVCSPKVRTPMHGQPLMTRLQSDSTVQPESPIAHLLCPVQVCSPLVRTPVHGQPPAWRHTRGDVLLKLLSPAYAVEWILVDGLRPGPQL